MDNFENENVTSEPIRYPGKEITAFVLGIVTLTNSIPALCYSFVPVSGFVSVIITFFIVAGCAIASFILCSQVKKNATEYTSKVKKAQTFCIIGLIISALSVILGILSLVLNIVPVN